MAIKYDITPINLTYLEAKLNQTASDMQMLSHPKSRHAIKSFHIHTHVNNFVMHIHHTLQFNSVAVILA